MQKKICEFRSLIHSESTSEHTNALSILDSLLRIYDRRATPTNHLGKLLSLCFAFDARSCLFGKMGVWARSKLKNTILLMLVLGWYSNSMFRNTRQTFWVPSYLIKFTYVFVIRQTVFMVITVGGFPICIDTKISKVIPYSLAIFKA